MKKKWLGLLSLLCYGSMAFGLSACSEEGSKKDGWGTVYSFETAYAQAQELGYAGTLEEFIAQISGAQGEQGIQGAQGEKGEKGEQGIQGVQGEKGDSGVGVKAVALNGKGELVITLTDGSEINCGKVVGEKGDQGEQGIQGEKGDQGEQGIQGEKGDQGEQGIQGEKGDKGEQGDQGEQGKSAYELYKENFGYEGTEQEWLLDLVNGNLVTQERTITFKADGKVVVSYPLQDSTIVLPDVPEKEGYTGTWESFTYSEGSVVVNAVYTPIPYVITFKVDGQTVGTDTYTADDKEVTEPQIPNKEYYTAAWESYSLTTGDITVNAVYTPIVYTVTFKVDGQTIGTDTYTVEDRTVTEPQFPEKEGLMGVWESYTLTAGDMTVNGTYKPISYTITFKIDGEIVGTDTYAPDDKTVTEPSIPEKVGYTGEWIYTLTEGDITVEATYTPDVVYTLNGEEYQVTGVNTSKTDIVILERYNGKPVTSIGDATFQGRASLTSITIPDSIIAVGGYAFYGCTNLIETVGGISYVGNWAVGYDAQVTSVTLREGTKGIAGSTFYGNSLLADVTLPDSLLFIGENAFYECTGLTTVTIGEKGNLTTIGKQAFYNCSKLASITIPDGVTSIGEYAFYNCDGLASVTFGENSQLTSIGDYAFHYCYDLTSITIPDSATSIGYSAFV